MNTRQSSVPCAPIATRLVAKSVIATILIASLFTLVVGGCSGPRTGPSVVDADAPTEFTETESGLQYRILRRSDGPMPKPNDKVRVDYTGWLDDGTVFDSSYDNKQSASFQLAAVVPGWTEGLQYLGEGGMIELIIPHELGYGERGKPPKIPPNATLHFKVELLAIE